MLSSFNKCCSTLTSNGVVALPTETVYGLAANALSESAVKEIYRLKGRPKQNPLIIHILEPSDAEKVAFTNSSFVKLTESLWLWTTICNPQGKRNCTQDYNRRIETVALRSPKSEIFRNVLKKTKLFLAAPSANISNRLSPTQAIHVLDSFKDHNLPIYDGGSSIIGLESTVIDLTVSPPEILRPGPIGKETLETTLGENVLLNKKLTSQNPKSPGINLVHYSPITPLNVYKNEEELIQQKKGILILFSSFLKSWRVELISRLEMR